MASHSDALIPWKMVLQKACQSRPAEASIFVSHVRSVDESTPDTFFLRSNGELIRAFPNDRSRVFCCERGPYHFLGSRFSVQISNLHCFVIVHCNELPERFHYSAATSLQQTWNNYTNLTVAIFPLVCQALKRVDQVFAGSLWCRMSPKKCASRLSVLSCMTKTLVGPFQSYWPPHASHHQLHCCFPCPAETHQM